MESKFNQHNNLNSTTRNRLDQIEKKLQCIQSALESSDAIKSKIFEFPTDIYLIERLVNVIFTEVQSEKIPLHEVLLSFKIIEDALLKTNLPHHTKLKIRYRGSEIQWYF